MYKLNKASKNENGDCNSKSKKKTFLDFDLTLFSVSRLALKLFVFNVSAQSTLSFCCIAGETTFFKNLAFINIKISHRIIGLVEYLGIGFYVQYV